MKHVQSYVERGKTYRYFRAGKQKVRLYGEPDSPEFWEQYNALLAATVTRDPSTPGTIGALIDDFKRSPEYQQLSDRTRHYYAVDLDRLRIVGKGTISDLKRVHVLNLRDELADRPRTADHFVQVARRLLSWAVERGYLEHNPLLRVGMLNKAVSHTAWTVADCDRFEASEPPAAMMTAYMLGRYTGQRRGDVVRLAWSRYDGTGIELVQGKTGACLWIPCHSALRDHLDAMTREATVILTHDKGQAWHADSLSHAFARSAAAAGLPHLTYHGLRHMAATELANVGCSDRDIMAITGHKTPAMVQRYTQRADQRRRASAAILRLERKA